MRLLSFLALALFVPVAGAAQTVGDVLPGCERALALRDEGRPTQAAIYCLGLVSGVMGMAWLNCQDLQRGRLSPNPARSATRPPSHNAALQAFVAWAQEYPDDRDASASAGMANALAVTFPCEHEPLLPTTP